MKLIILDRDGVINQDSDAYIKSEEEWQQIPGSLEAIAQLNKHGYKIAVTTNQSGINRGFYDHDTLNSMHNKLRRLLTPLGGKIDAIFYCPHIPEDQCTCRKPMPGLFHRVNQFFGTPLNGVFAIGDSFRDLQAAMQVSAKPVLVLTGKGKITLDKNADEIKTHNIPVFQNLSAAVQEILTRQS